jgi:hypothetical protein
MSDTLFPDVKTFYDEQGQPREVLLSYETFHRIESLIRELQAQPDQGYFWTEDWQTRIREAEEDIACGRTHRATSDTLDAALGWLDE